MFLSTPSHPLWAQGLQTRSFLQHLHQFSLNLSPEPEIQHTEKQKRVLSFLVTPKAVFVNTKILWGVT